MVEDSPGTAADAVAEAGSRMLEGATSAVDQLEDEPDEVLLRHVAGNSDGDVNDQTDLTLYSASVFILRERGYETDTVDGKLVVFDPDGQRVSLESF
jgi:hypothetical protein